MSIDFETLALKPCINSFGKPVIYQYKSGQTMEINAVCDEVTHQHDPMSGMDAGDSGVMASRTVIGISLADFAMEPDMGDKVTFNGSDYYVQEVQKDGQGGAHLVLNNAEI